MHMQHNHNYTCIHVAPKRLKKIVKKLGIITVENKFHCNVY